MGKFDYIKNKFTSSKKYIANKLNKSKDFVLKKYNDIIGITNLEASKSLYESTFNDLKKEYENIDSLKLQLNTKLSELVQNKIKALEEVSKFKKILKNIKITERNSVEVVNSEVVKYSENVNKFNTQFTHYDLQAYGKGLAAGLSTGLGAWTLVATFGTASTGTAISTLSGIAATNSILAFLGGGSLATGGLGIIGGTFALGGITLAPILISIPFYKRMKNNTLAKEINLETIKMLKEIDKCKNVILFLENLSNETDELNNSLVYELARFNEEFARVYKIIFPFSFISKLVKSIKSLLGFSYYNEKELIEINYMLIFVQQILVLVDKKVIPSEDELKEELADNDDE